MEVRVQFSFPPDVLDFLSLLFSFSLFYKQKSTNQIGWEFSRIAGTMKLHGVYFLFVLMKLMLNRKSVSNSMGTYYRFSKPKNTKNIFFLLLFLFLFWALEDACRFVHFLHPRSTNTGEYYQALSQVSCWEFSVLQI